MRIVVLGATGNVGTSVVQQLTETAEVEQIVGVARRTPEWLPPRTQWVERDVAKDDLTEVISGADAVVHLAWAFQPSHRPAVTWDVNVIGTTRVLDAVVRARVPALVYASSVGAYSPVGEDSADKSVRVDESWPTHGWSPAAYCREKAYLERVLDAFELEDTGCRVVRMRPAFLFKKESAPQQRRIFAGPLVPERLAGRIRLPLLPDLAGLAIQALHTDDAAAAYVQAVLSDARGAFNLAAEPVLDAEALSEVFGGRPTRIPTRAARQALAAAWHARLVPAAPDLFDYVLKMPLMDTTRAQEVLGWTPGRTSQEALDELRAGLRDPDGFPTPPLGPSSGRQAAAATVTG
jgi:nucleoside-diphosphate-sugar epimerase